MDAGRIWLVRTIASVSLALAFAAPQSSEGAGQSGWAGAQPSAAPSYTSQPTYPSQPSYSAPGAAAPNYGAPTYGAPSYDRYGTPTSGTQPAYGQPATISQRTQNAATETATTLRDGFDATVRAAKDGTQGLGQQFQSWGSAASQQMQAAGSSIRSTTDPALGTNTNQPRFTNPFAQPAAAPSTSVNARTQPPPWPNSSNPSTTAAAAAPTQAWPASTSTSASPVQPGPNGEWSSIGSSIASPPMLIPQLSTSSDTPFNSDAPITTVVGRNGPTFPAEQASSRQDSTHSVLAPPAQPAPTGRSAADDWSWGNTTDTSAATIGRGASPPPRAELSRDSNTAPSIAAAPQDTKKTSTTTAKDLWADDPWAKPATSSPGTPATSATVTAPTISATNNKQQPVASTSSQLPFPATAASPSLNQPANGQAPSSVNFASAQTPIAPTAGPPNPAKPNQPGAAAEEKPWVLMILAVLGLAGSLAANFFLGWSYLDTRQKYQSLVRRTADTFRRTKQAAA